MKTLVLLSGGIDSTVLLADLLSRGEAEAISFDYGQRHRRELFSAYDVVRHYGVRHYVVELGLAPHLKSALTNHSDVPTGPYNPENLAQTVVPNRNAIFLMTAAGVAASNGIMTVATAVHAGDHAVYADCRLEFIEAASHASELACGVEIVAPFVRMSKREIATLGKGLDVPLDKTWSCYQSGPVQCGTCSTCLERAEALA